LNPKGGEPAFCYLGEKIMRILNKSVFLVTAETLNLASGFQDVFKDSKGYRRIKHRSQAKLRRLNRQRR